MQFMKKGKNNEEIATKTTNLPYKIKLEGKIIINNIIIK